MARAESVARSLRYQAAASIAATTLALLATAPSSESSHNQLSGNACIVRLSGLEKPDMLPAQSVWEATFERERQGDLRSLSSSGRAQIAQATTPALAKVAALRKGLTAELRLSDPQAAADREMIIADTILDVRDELIRDLSEAEFEALRQEAAGVSETLIVTLPFQGRRMKPMPDGTILCEVAVSGRLHPHFLPEHKIWEHFLRTWAGAARMNAQLGNVDRDAYERMLERTSFRMSNADVQAFLSIATATSDELDALEVTRTEHDEERAYQGEVRRLVDRGRRQLVRRLSREGWRTVQAKVEEGKIGSKWWYRSRLLQ